MLSDGHVRMGLHKHLRDIEVSLAIINEFPELTHLPVVIGESDPEGCAAWSARVKPQNGYRNGPLYGAYVVESMIRTYELSRRAGIHIEGAVTWAFLFEDQPYFDGFRDLATNGIDKAVLNGFRMMGKLGGQWVESGSDHRIGLESILHSGVREQPDIDVAATQDEDGLSILVWHYHDDDEPGAPAEIVLHVDGWGDAAPTLQHFRMDDEHSNALATWQAMGEPQKPEGADYARLEAAGQLARIGSDDVRLRDGRLELRFTLPRQGVSLLRFDKSSAG